MINVPKPPDFLGALGIMPGQSAASNNHAGGNPLQVKGVKSIPSQCNATDVFYGMPLEIFEEICKNLDLPDMVSFAKAYPLDYGHQVSSSFRGLPVARKKEQWIRFVIGGDFPTLRFCIDSGVGGKIVNATDEEGDSALGLAIAEKRFHITRTLLAHPEIDPNSGVPLACATSKGDFTTMKILLQMPGIDVNLRWRGRTALSHAAQCAQLKCVEVLLNDPRVDANAIDHSGRNFLHAAPEQIGLKIREIFTTIRQSTPPSSIKQLS